MSASDDKKAFFAGCNEELMEKGRKTKANEEWIVDGDDITLKVTSTFRDKTLHFKLGEEVDETTIDRRHVRVGFYLFYFVFGVCLCQLSGYTSDLRIVDYIHREGR